MKVVYKKKILDKLEEEASDGIYWPVVGFFLAIILFAPILAPMPISDLAARSILIIIGLISGFIFSKV